MLGVLGEGIPARGVGPPSNEHTNGIVIHNVGAPEDYQIKLTKPDDRIALMHDDVTLFLVTSKRDLVVKISWKLKRNIVHIEHVCWKFYKMKNRQNDSNNLVFIPTKPRFGVERKFCDVICISAISNRDVQYVLYSS